MSDVVQGSAEWIALRLGKATASRIADVVARTKTGWGASRANYMAELIAERLTGTAAEHYTNAAMEWGSAHEAEARAAYQFLTDVDVAEVGFVPHPTIAMSGTSPDGLVNDRTALVADWGLVEIKCPGTAQQINTLLGEPIAGKYITQMQWQMACTGREWCDWVSYDPRLPANMRLHVERVERDDKMIAALERDVVEFLAEVDGKVDALNKMYGEKAAA